MKGTVFFRESKSRSNQARAKRTGTWTYAFSLSTPDGGRRQVSKGGYATKKACEEALTEALAEHGRSPAGPIEPSKKTVASYLLDDWLPTTSSLKKSTAAAYRHHVESYIVPRIGHIRLCDLSAGQIVKLYEFLKAQGGMSRKKGAEPFTQPLSERTVHKTHVVLRSSLGHAVELGMLRINPVLQVPKKNRPKQRDVNTHVEMKVWTADDASSFLELAAGDRWLPIYDFDLNTGARRGELAGAMWADIDLDAGTFSVRRTRVVVDNEVVETTPKNGKPRVVDLDSETVAMLRRWRRRQLEERLAWGEAWTDSCYVFTNEDGTALHPGTISWHLERLIRKTGLPMIRLHDLRHTHATLGLAAGVPVKVMSERLGHTSTQITNDLYAHVIPGMQADAASRIGGLLRRSG